MLTRIEDLTGEQAAWAIERFAEWVAATPGVWAVTVADARYGRASVDLHLIVHANLEEVSPDEAAALGWEIP
ncbi:MAG: hypothetical protein ACRDJ4_10210 [Actinomycetota bacterium]